MAAIFVSIFFFLIAIKLMLIWKHNGKYKFPKGPRGIPLLGNLFQIVKDPHLKLSHWVREYGPLYTISLGPRPTLVLSNVQLIKEMFSQHVSTGKFKNDTFLLISRGNYGILSTEGAAWSEQRQFCLRNMIKFGFGNKCLEPLILSDCQELIQLIKEETRKSDDGGIEINRCLSLATNNALMTIVSGKRVGLKDQKISELLNEFMHCFQNTMKTGLGLFPWLKHIAPVASGYVAFDKSSRKLHQFIIEQFETHKQTRVADHPNDLIDAYLDKLEITDDKTSSFYGEAGMLNSIASVVELFFAGSETTSVTIVWLLYFMAVHPEIQHKVHEELDSVLGNCGNEPSLQDKSRVPYTEAVILETMRMRPVVPIGTIHELLEDTLFHGYHLPKGMLLIANIYFCHHDKSVWKDPEVFRPERFLENENSVEKQYLSDHVIPFHVGKRNCFGEPLSKDVMFLFVTRILQEFEVLPVQEISAEEYLEPDMGQVLLPHSRKIVMKARESN